MCAASMMFGIPAGAAVVPWPQRHALPSEQSRLGREYRHAEAFQPYRKIIADSRDD